MLDCSQDLADLLNDWRNDVTVKPFTADFYTITLSNGAVIRWVESDRDLSFGGLSYLRGPGIDRGQITRQTGSQASQFEVTLYLDDTLTYNGVALSNFILGGGLLNATLRFDRAYARALYQPIVGTLPKFTGRITQIKDGGDTQITIVISNWMNLLNVQVPVNELQPPCLHHVFDSGCRLNRADYAKNGTVQAGSDTLTVHTDLALTAAYLDLGTISFLTGANAGQTRAVKSQDGSGVIVLVRPLPAPPAPGDKVVAYPGCDLTSATCKAKFNNLAHRKGYDFVPLNETAAP